MEKESPDNRGAAQQVCGGRDGNRLDNCKCRKREPSTVVATQARSIKNSVILVTGAAVGGAAGLIYNCLTYKLPGKI